MKYFRTFRIREEYDAYVAEGAEVPSVSYVIEENDVEYTPYTSQYLTLKAVTECSIAFSGNAVDISLDSGVTWESLPSASAVTLDKNKTMQFRANLTPNTTIGIGKFVTTGTFDAYGNVLSLVRANGFDTNFDISGTANNCIFMSLFAETGVRDAGRLALPSPSVPASGYTQMFYKCQSLLKAPDILADSIGSAACRSMFSNCTNLTEPPILNFTTIARDGCFAMFYSATSLTYAPVLKMTSIPISGCTVMFARSGIISCPDISATTVAASGCASMFYHCTRLKETGTLGFTSVGERSFYCMYSDCTSLTSVGFQIKPLQLTTHTCSYMFSGCTSLITAPEIAATAATGAHAMYKMFNGCSNLITPPPEIKLDNITSGACREMFSDCKKLTTTPVFRASKTSGGNCLYGAFSGCTSLQRSAYISAATLAANSFRYMYHTSKITTLSDLPATNIGNACYSFMFYNCSGFTQAPAISATTIGNSGMTGMFANCKSLTIPPAILPATTLKTQCYDRMFSACTAIKDSPVLPATTLVSRCYERMFNGCTNLSGITAMFTTTPDTTYTSAWTYNVSSTGTFRKNSAATWTTTGEHGIPTNWTVVQVDPATVSSADPDAPMLMGGLMMGSNSSPDDDEGLNDTPPDDDVSPVEDNVYIWWR